MELRQYIHLSMYFMS